MARLVTTANTVLRHPETHEVEFIAAGSQIPEWATGLVGDHLVVDADNGAISEGEDQDPVDYESWKVDDLREEIRLRNETRAQEDLISDKGNKSDLVAALVVDDIAHGITEGED